MGSALYGFFLTAIVSRWLAWILVLCWERGCFRGVWAELRNMSPLTRAVMAVLCAYCTVIAQKPSNAGSGGTGGSGETAQTSETSGPVSEASELVPAEEESVLSRQQSTGEPTQPQTLIQSPAAPEEPSRVVFQSAPASDTRTAVAFGGETGWGTPAAVPVTSELESLSFDGGATNVPSPVCFPARPTQPFRRSCSPRGGLRPTCPRSSTRPKRRGSASRPKGRKSPK